MSKRKNNKQFKKKLLYINIYKNDLNTWMNFAYIDYLYSPGGKQGLDQSVPNLQNMIVETWRHGDYSCIHSLATCHTVTQWPCNSVGGLVEFFCGFKITHQVHPFFLGKFTTGEQGDLRLNLYPGLLICKMKTMLYLHYRWLGKSRRKLVSTEWPPQDSLPESYHEYCHSSLLL